MKRWVSVVTQVVLGLGQVTNLVEPALTPRTKVYVAGGIALAQLVLGRIFLHQRARLDCVFLLQQRLQDRGLSVRIGDIRDAGNKAQARLTVMPGSER